MESLVKIDENLTPQPWLAEKFDVSADGLTYTFTLRQGIKFHDGTDLDAEAVKFSVDRIREFQGGPAYVSAQYVTDSVAVDKYTYRMTLKEPFAPWLNEMAGRIGIVVSPKAVREMGDEKFGLNPVGTGPFTFQQFQNDNFIRLAKNEGYWRDGADGKKLPYLDGVELRIITEPANRLTALQAGDVHVAPVSDQDLEIVKKDSNLVWSQEPGFGWSSFLLTVTKPPFDNKALRQAVSFAIDRDEIVQVIYEGNLEPGNGPMPPPHAWALDPSYKPYTYDIEKAKQKLAEGGRPNGLEFTGYFSAGSAVTQRLAELMAAQMARAGITMKIELADFNGVVIPKAKAQDPGAFGISFNCDFDPDPCVASRFLGGGSFNYMGYDNPKVTELILKARSSNNREERARLYKEVVPMIMDDAPAVIFGYSTVRYVGNKNVNNWYIRELPRMTQGYSEFWLSN
jgi:peptide/nickel transport system substrate-binding protein